MTRILARTLGSATCALGLQARVLLLKGARAVLEKDQPGEYVLIRGGVHVGAQGAGGAPDAGFEAVAGRGGIVVGHAACSFEPSVSIESRVWHLAPLGQRVGCQPFLVTVVVGFD
jgi:hypothetical protein